MSASLVSALGYRRYGVHGGDWGSMVAAKLGAAYPERVAGIQFNMLVAPPPAQPREEDAGRDTLLTNIMFDWAPNSVASAARIYYENARDAAGVVARGRVDVPVGYAEFPHEIYRPARCWVEPDHAIARWTEMPRGGHFAASRHQTLSRTCSPCSRRCAGPDEGRRRTGRADAMRRRHRAARGRLPPRR